jgi:lipoprotein-releasing system permease protein
MTYFYTGILIVISGVITGLIFGTAFAISSFTQNSSEPMKHFLSVKIVGKNYLIVALTASIFGIAISWFFSKISKEYITKS